MSIILGMVFKNGAIVSSDGRTIYNGKVVENEFDKTFSTADGKFIGACSGLANFQHKKTLDHILEILSEASSVSLSLNRTIEFLMMEMVDRLEAISPHEVSFPHRKIDIILISGEKPNHEDLAIYAFRLAPDSTEARIEGVFKKIPEIDKTEIIYFATFGEEPAQDGLVRFLYQEFSKSPYLDYSYLEDLSLKAIKSGIESSQKLSGGTETICGGSYHSHSIKW